MTDWISNGESGLSVRAKLNSIPNNGITAIINKTYFVSSSGNDANDGLTEALPWKTISKVVSVLLVAGTAVLFQGGQSFSGSLVPSILGASAVQTIIFGSYGSDRATISSSAGNGFTSSNFGGIVVRDLDFIGSASTNRGIFISTTGATSNVHLENVQVINCVVSGYGWDG